MAEPSSELLAPGGPCRAYAVVRVADWRGRDMARAGGAALRLLEHGDVALVVADLPADAGPARRDVRGELLFQELAVERLARAGAPVAPVAPLEAPQDEPALRAWLEAAAPSFRDLLARLEGCCEIGVLAWWDRAHATSSAGASPADASTADAYQRAVAASAEQRARLLSRLAREPMASTFLPRRVLRAREAEAAEAYGERLAAAAHARLCAAAEVGRRASPPTEEVLLDAAYLVRRERLAALDLALREAAALCGEGTRMQRSPPRAAWGFATLRPFTRDAPAAGAMAPARGGASERAAS